jgi:hypothetical protein
MKEVGVILAGIVIVAFALLFSGLLLALPVMWLWNYTLPSIFQLPEIGYWQAFCLYYLCGLLFKTTMNRSTDKTA